MGVAIALILASGLSFGNTGSQFAARRAFRCRTQMEMGGLDSDGRTFKNADEMWREQVGDDDPQKKFQWYNKAINFWQVRPFISIIYYIISTHVLVVACLICVLFVVIPRAWKLQWMECWVDMAT